MHLGSLWDMVARVVGQFQEWKQTPWGAIDVDFLVEETRKLLRDIKTLHKAIRAYPVYRQVPADPCLSSEHELSHTLWRRPE